MLNLDELFDLFEQIEPELKLLEEQQSKVVPIELFSVEITEKLGDTESSPAREELEKMIANATGISGPGKVTEKLNALQRAVASFEKENDVSKLMAQVTILSSMYKMLSSFQPSPAGFLNEAFMSVFYGTEQKKINPEADDEDPEGDSRTEIADVYTHSDEGNLPVSLKTIRTDGNVGGSKKLLEQAVNNNGKVLFHIYEKGGDLKAPQQISFYEFVVDEKNLANITGRDYSPQSLEENRLKRLRNFTHEMIMSKDPKGFIQKAIKENEFPQKYDWTNQEDNKMFFSALNKAFRPSKFRTSIEDMINQHIEAKKQEKGKKKRFELDSKTWKAMSGGPKAVLNIDPAITNNMIENKIKILNKSIVDLALHIKELSSSLKNYCFSKDPEKVQFGDKAMEASKQVFPETQKAVSSFKEE